MPISFPRYDMQAHRVVAKSRSCLRVIRTRPSKRYSTVELNVIGANGAWGRAGTAFVM